MYSEKLFMYLWRWVDVNLRIQKVLFFVYSYVKTFDKKKKQMNYLFFINHSWFVPVTTRENLNDQFRLLLYASRGNKKSYIIDLFQVVQVLCRTKLRAITNDGQLLLTKNQDHCPKVGKKEYIPMEEYSLSIIVRFSSAVKKYACLFIS